MIFDTQIDGHHLEYLHHIYSNIENEGEYIFVIPENFLKVKSKFQWEKKCNISFDFIPTKFLNVIDASGHLGKSFRLSSLLKHYVGVYAVQSVFLISLIDYFPALYLFKLNTKVSGIIYKIYLYEWKDYTWKAKLYESIRQWSMIKYRDTNKILILNDNQAVKYLSKKWNSEKFLFLPDPYLPLVKIKNLSLKEEFGIPKNNIVFLHMGAMDYRKGTLDLIRSINYINLEKNSTNMTFIFAGVISNQLHNDFYEEFHKVRNKCQILLFDEFCDYEFLGKLCQVSDCFVLPYKRVSLSSGVLYYAAQFGKFVIGPSKGLIKKLIRRNGLGICIDCTPQSLANAIENYCGEKPNIKKDFITNSKVENFTSIILSNI